MPHLFNLTVPLLFLLSSTLIVVSSPSWFLAWIGLEINLIAFIPLLASQNKLAAETTLKYFFIQASASALIFFFSAHNFYYSAITSLFTLRLFPCVGITLALLLKLGAAPLHFWFPAIIEGLTWFTATLLLTWQKIAPFMLLWALTKLVPSILVLFALISALVGALGGISQLLIRKLIAYSSITHIGWMLYSLLLSKLVFIIYFFIYCLLTLTILIVFKSTKTFHLTQLFTPQTPLILEPSILCLNFLSLGGLPPFLGFLPKWVVLKARTTYSMLILALILVLCSVIALYYYLRLSYSAIIITSKTPSYLFNLRRAPSAIKILSLINVTSLPLVALLFIN